MFEHASISTRPGAKIRSGDFMVKAAPNNLVMLQIIFGAKPNANARELAKPANECFQSQCAAT